MFKACADSFFSIGTGHHVCQDYARVTKHNEFYRGILLDGCSSSVDTDIGARLIATEHISHLDAYDTLGIHASLEATVGTVRKLGLSETCLDATVLTLDEMERGIRVTIHGDGFILFKQKDGTIQILEYDCGNMPNYLSYSLVFRGARGKGNTPAVTRHFLSEGVFTSFANQLSCPDMLFSKHEVDLIVLSTDGLGSFVKDTPTGCEKVRIEEIAPRILDIPVFTGEFMQRRGRSLEKWCRKNGWHHYDDIGFLAIKIEEVE